MQAENASIKAFKPLAELARTPSTPRLVAHAFLDEKRVIAEDLKHSQEEQRYYCFGSNEEGTGILTVRFTYRSGRIRIIGAGYWREGKKVYEQANSV